MIGASPEPVLIAWTQSFTLDDGVPRERRTILAAVGLEPYERRVVRPHERTHAGPVEDRLRLTRAVRANLSPVFGLYPDAAPVGLGRARASTATPDAELADRDGTVHRFWRVTDPAAHAAVAEALRDRWILIADGHHRYETALAYRDERRAQGAGNGAGAPYDRVLMGLTALEDPGLVVLPTHRVLTRWPEGAEGAFASRPVDGIEALRRGPGRRARGRPGPRPGAAGRDAPPDGPAARRREPGRAARRGGARAGDPGPRTSAPTRRR